MSVMKPGWQARDIEPLDGVEEQFKPHEAEARCIDEGTLP